MKKAGMVLTAFIMVLASVFSASAIGFDAETVYGSVFVVSTKYTMGSGFAVGKSTLITNAHVVGQNSKVTITTYSGNTFTGTVYSTDEYLDLAVVIVTDARLSPMAFADENKAHIGDDIYTIGAPNSMTYTLTKGVISAKDRLVSGQTYLQIDAAINTGNSGGPLLNDAGQVLGINTLKLSNSEGIGLAIPISRALAYLDSCGIDVDKPKDTASSEADASGGVTDEDGSRTDKTDSGITQPPSTNRKQMILFASIISFVLLFAILVILLVYRKNKDQYVTSDDPSDRTDFEIDLME